MQKYYVITMWTGGTSNRKWQSTEEPELIPQGTGVRFRSIETKLMVQVIGNVSVEEYESGLEYLEAEREDLPQSD